MELFRSLADVNRALGPQEQRVAAELCEVSKAFLKQRALQLVSEAGVCPVLFSYQADATPSQPKHTVGSNVEGHRRLQRRGRAGMELLVQKAFLATSTVLGEPKMAVLFRDALPLTAGKSTWCLYSAAVDFFPLLRECGCTSITISHYAFDRAVYSGLGRKLIQRHMRYHADLRSTEPEAAELLDLLDWQVSTPCCHHDVHNALRWSLARHIDGADGIHDLHIAIESLRNSFDLLHGNLKSFIGQALETTAEPFDAEAVSRFWTLLGVAPDIVDLLAELNLHWSGGRLYVSAASMEHPDAIERISTAILHIFRFRKFTTGRWLTVGESCRTLTAALCVGLAGLVDLIRKSPKTSEFYIHGFGRLAGQARKYCVIAGVSSHIADAFLAQLLEDDRLATRGAELQQVLADELAWLAGVEPFAWARLASLFPEGYAGPALRSECVGSACIAAAFITRQVLQPLKKCPWSLAQGDIQANLQALGAQDHVPRDPTAQKIQTLVRLGYNTAQLTRGLELLRRVSWSTSVAEQAHASVSVFAKLHPEYGANMLAQRALIHMMRPLVVPPKPTALDRMESTLRRLERKQPAKLSGRQVFLKEAIAAAQATSNYSPSQKKAVAMGIMKRHATKYNELSEREKAAYTRAAHSLAGRRERAIEEDIEHLRSAQKLATARQAEESLCHGPLLRDSACRFTEPDLKALAQLRASGGASQRLTKELRLKASTAPTPPSKQHMEELGQFTVPSDPHRLGQLPEWRKQVCRNRDFFENTALSFRREGSTTVFAFMYAKLRPMLAMFAPLLPKAQELPHAASMSSAERVEALNSHVDHEFFIEWGEFQHEVAWDETTEIAVLPLLFYDSGNLVCSHADFVPFDKFMEGVPKPSAKAPSKAEHEVAANELKDTDLATEYPWLKAYTDKAADQTEADEEHHPEEEVDSETDSLPPTSDDEAAEAAFAALQHKLLTWQGQVQAGDDFITCVRGGKWTSANRTKPFEGVRAYARGEGPKLWCRQYGLQDTASFSFATHTEAHSSVLALAWRGRMQWLYDLHLEKDTDSYQYTEEDLQGFQEQPAFASLVEQLAANAKSRPRALQIRAIRPGAPKW